MSSRLGQVRESRKVGLYRLCRVIMVRATTRLQVRARIFLAKKRVLRQMEFIAIQKRRKQRVIIQRLATGGTLVLVLCYWLLALNYTFKFDPLRDEAWARSTLRTLFVEICVVEPLFHATYIVISENWCRWLARELLRWLTEEN